MALATRGESSYSQKCKERVRTDAQLLISVNLGHHLMLHKAVFSCVFGFCFFVCLFLSLRQEGASEDRTEQVKSTDSPSWSM